MIQLNGVGLTIEDVVKVARDRVPVCISQEAKERTVRTREYVEKKVSERAVIYGITTGFGKFSDTLISAEQTSRLQKNLIMSHACAVGKPLATEAVRAAMLLRANSLSHGNSGIRLTTLQTLVDMLNKGVHPIVPRQGSLGASGDLAPLSHIVLVMLGEGEAEYEGQLLPGKEAMAKAGIPTVERAAKEGLCLINGTQVMSAIGCLAVYDAMKLATVADIAAALTSEALLGITIAYDEKAHLLRPHQGQLQSAANLRALLQGSNLSHRTRLDRVQDAYSLRCVPQVHGASRDAIGYAYNALTTEINSVTDNPLIFPEEDETISCGHFHGQPIALAMDFLGIALSEYANISERRIERLVNPQLSGLPAFLVHDGGINSGFMIAQYVAASLVSENKVNAHPASVDSIPSSANQEDHVSMGTTAARKALAILENAQRVLGIELMAATQGISFRGEEKMSPVTRKIFAHVRKQIPFVEQDMIMYPELNKAYEMIKDESLYQVAREACPELN